MIDIQLIQKAISLSQIGKTEDAEKLYTQMLNEYPDEVILLSAAGLFYVSINHYEKAIELLEKAYSIKKTVGTVSALGFVEYKKRNYKRAALILHEALEYGQNVDIYDKLAASLYELRDYKNAVVYSEKMYELYPDDIRAKANKVKALTQSGKLIEAERMCVEHLKKNAQEPIMWFHLGFLKELIYCDDTQAIECYKMAEKFGSKEANYNIAVSLQKLGKKKEAEEYYKKMLKYFPDEEEAKVSLGMCYLSQKKFNEGYKLFCDRDDGKVKQFSNNIWKPSNKLEDEVVVICEQGFGDHIQFIRYLPFLNSKSIKVAAMKQLKNLFQLNYPKYEFIEYSNIDPQMQALKITDLAYITGLDFEHIPYSEGYLNIETQQIQSNKLKVGLCWEAGAAGIRTMINRTIHIKCFEQFFNLDGIQIYSFQYDDTFKGCEKYPQMINLARDFKDFSDTAGALKSMDVVVSVDTAVAHLAGALGVKTYLLLPYAPDWRWFDDDKTTPWYKSVEIFKQKESISWEEPLNNIMQNLKSLANNVKD